MYVLRETRSEKENVLQCVNILSPRIHLSGRDVPYVPHHYCHLQTRKVIALSVNSSRFQI